MEGEQGGETSATLCAGGPVPGAVEGLVMHEGHDKQEAPSSHLVSTVLCQPHEDRPHVSTSVERSPRT